MMIYEITGASFEQSKRLKAFGETERIDRQTINVSVQDESVDDVVDWLDQEKLEYRAL